MTLALAVLFTLNLYRKITAPNRHVGYASASREFVQLLLDYLLLRIKWIVSSESPDKLKHIGHT
jgi:hypothetical protein